MMNIEQAFAAQLTGPKCDGTVAGRSTIEEVAKVLATFAKVPAGAEIPAYILEQARTKLDDMASHVGQSRVYYLVTRPGGFEILSSWEQEIAALAEDYELMDPVFTDGENSLPRLTKKVKEAA